VGRHGAPRGHRFLPHTADVSIEAWGPTREECLAEAVTAMVAIFADVTGVRPSSAATVVLPDGPDEDVLVAVLSEVIVRLDVDGCLPVDVEVHRGSDGVEVVLALAALDHVRIIGAPPKAVSWHRLRCAAGPHGWDCSVVLDV